VLGEGLSSGIGSGSKTRIYPVRKGETIQAIAANRGIPLDKLTQLNPAVDLNKLKGGEKLLLPGGYYTVREKEMLSTVPPPFATLPPPYVFARAPNEGARI
jgi:LysM repeat protein